MRIRSVRNVAIAILLATGCQDEEFFPVVQIEEDFKSYVDAFVTEAASRGIELEIDNLILQWSYINQHVCATCNSTSTEGNIQKKVYINQQLACGTSTQEREAMIFHELGHCVLGREHLNTELPNGAPKSIMIAGFLGLYSICEYPLEEEECNKTYRRSYYLDELFNTGTPTPAWANP